MANPQSIPGYTPDPNFTYSPLCTTDESKLSYEIGKRYHALHREKNSPIWTTQVNAQRNNSLHGGEPYVMYVHVMGLFSMQIDALEKYLEGGEGGIPFQAQLKDHREYTEKTISQLVSGECPELNSLIEEIVLKKVEGLSLVTEEKAPIKEVKKQPSTTAPPLEKITNLLLRAENIHLKNKDVSERNQQMQAIFNQMEEINKELKKYPTEYELVKQTISLFNTMYPKK